MRRIGTSWETAWPVILRSGRWILARAMRGLFWIYHFSGLRFIVLKFTGKPSNDPVFREPPSGMIWILGLYIAAFGFADQQYNRSVDAALYLTQNQPNYPDIDIGNECNAFVTYLNTVKYGPLKPMLFSPVTVLQSIFGERAPLMDTTFNSARRVENSAHQNLVLVTIFGDESVMSDKFEDRYLGFEGFEESLQTFKSTEPILESDLESYIESRRVIFGAFARSDFIEQNLEENAGIRIDADGAAELLDVCGPVFKTFPESIRESQMRFICTLHMLGRVCAAGHHANDLQDTESATTP